MRVILGLLFLLPCVLNAQLPKEIMKYKVLTCSLRKLPSETFIKLQKDSNALVVLDFIHDKISAYSGDHSNNYSIVQTTGPFLTGQNRVWVFKTVDDDNTPITIKYITKNDSPGFGGVYFLSKGYEYMYLVKKDE